jgi:hypothetical protein
MLQRWALVLSVAAAITPAGMAGTADVESVLWSRLAARVGRNKVALVLPGGTHVEGRARAVGTNGLDLKVSKTSDRKIIGKGLQTIPKRDVTLLQLTEYGNKGRILGTLGALALAGGIVAAQQIDIYEGPALIIVPAVVAGGMTGAGIGGYYAGKAFDKRVVAIRVVDDDSAAPAPRGYRLVKPQPAK